MHALRLVAPGAPLELQDVARREPGDDEVLIHVAGCGVCHTDIGFWKDGVATRADLPLTLGHEISGTVVDATPAFADTSRFRAGGSARWTIGAATTWRSSRSSPTR